MTINPQMMTWSKPASGPWESKSTRSECDLQTQIGSCMMLGVLVLWFVAFILLDLFIAHTTVSAKHGYHILRTSTLLYSVRHHHLHLS